MCDQVIQGTAHLRREPNFGICDTIVHLILSVEQTSVVRIMFCYYLAVENFFFLGHLLYLSHQKVLCLQFDIIPYSLTAYRILYMFINS